MMRGVAKADSEGSAAFNPRRRAPAGGRARPSGFFVRDARSVPARDERGDREHLRDAAGRAGVGPRVGSPVEVPALRDWLPFSEAREVPCSGASRRRKPARSSEKNFAGGTSGQLPCPRAVSWRDELAGGSAIEGRRQPRTRLIMLVCPCISGVSR